MINIKLIGWLGFNGTFSTNRLYRAIEVMIVWYGIVTHAVVEAAKVLGGSFKLVTLTPKL